MQLFETAFRDFRHAFRLFRQSPAFALAAVAALTLGIGANTAIFSVVNTVLLTPVAVHEPDRLVIFMNTSPAGDGPGASPAKFMHWRRQTDVIQDAAAFRTGVLNYTGGELPEQLRSGQASADFFTLFGAPMRMGRTFTAAEDLPNGERVALLSEQMWSRRFGSNPDIIGQTVSLDGDPHVIVGVLGDFAPAMIANLMFGKAAASWMANLPRVGDLPGGYYACGYNTYVSRIYNLQLLKKAAGYAPPTLKGPLERGLWVFGAWLGYINLLTLMAETLDDPVYGIPPVPPGERCPIF